MSGRLIDNISVYFILQLEPLLFQNFMVRSVTQKCYKQEEKHTWDPKCGFIHEENNFLILEFFVYFEKWKKLV